MKNKNFRFLLLLFLPVFLNAQSPSNPDDGPANTEAEFERQYQERIKKDKLNGVYIPKNLEEAMLELDKRISAESKLKIKGIPEDSVCLVMHNRLGQWLILNWGFYGGSRLSHYIRSAGITYPDDMADFIILAYHRRLNSKPIGIKELATDFKETRKREFEEKLKKGKVLHEEVRKKN
jgi:hypothetical protein